MKKFYFAVTLVILTFSAFFIGYGMYLNSTSNSYIETMLATRAVSLSGIMVSYRDIYPELYLDNISMRTRNQADVITEIDGLIEELYVSNGQEIEYGQPLCKIVNKDVPLAIAKANTDVARAESAYLQLLNTVERNRRLASADAISMSELEASVSQMKAAKAELDVTQITKKQIEQQMSSQIVISPLSGAVIVLYQNSGNFIAKGTPIAMVADFSKMYFTVMVKDKDISNIVPIVGKFSLKRRSTVLSTVFSTMPIKSSFNEKTTFNVEISSILPPLSESVPVRSVTCEVDNRLGVMELGMYTDIVIRKNTMKRVLAIPSSVIFEKDGTKVYVCDANSRLAVRDIRIGIYDSEYVEVAEGLEEGDVVITSGVEGLDLGIKIEANVGE